MRLIRLLRSDGPASGSHHSYCPCGGLLGPGCCVCDSMKDTDLVPVRIKADVQFFLKSGRRFGRRDEMKPFSILLPLNSEIIRINRLWMFLRGNPQPVPAIAVVYRFFFLADLVMVLDKEIGVANEAATQDSRPDLKGDNQIDLTVVYAQAIVPPCIRYDGRLNQRSPLSLSYPERLTGSWVPFLRTAMRLSLE